MMLGEGEHVGALVDEDEKRLVTFTGKSDGKTRMIGTKTERAKDDGEVCFEEGMFDCEGELHSFDEEGIHFMCKEGDDRGRYKFDGYYIHGKRNGDGVETWRNGEVCKGKWKNDERDGPFEIQSTINERKVTIFKNYNQGEEEEFGKVFFHDDASIYVGESSSLSRLDGKGILLDVYGILVGVWSRNSLAGIETVHLCDMEGTVVDLTQEKAGERISKQNPEFRVRGDTELERMQMREVSRFLGKKRTLERLLCRSSSVGRFFYEDVFVSTW